MKVRIGTIAAILMILALIAYAGPKDDKLWILRLDNDAGFQITVPNLGVKEIHADAVQAVESVFADIGTTDADVVKLEKQIAELQAQLLIARDKAKAADDMKEVYEVAKDAAAMFTRHTFWVEKYGPIKEVAVTGLMAGKHRVAFAWSRMHPE